jgi:hypothetical protein
MFFKLVRFGSNFVIEIEIEIVTILVYSAVGGAAAFEL